MFLFIIKFTLKCIKIFFTYQNYFKFYIIKFILVFSKDHTKGKQDLFSFSNLGWKSRALRLSTQQNPSVSP